MRDDNTWYVSLFDTVFSFVSVMSRSIVSDLEFIRNAWKFLVLELLLVV